MSLDVHKTLSDCPRSACSHDDVASQVWVPSVYTSPGLFLAAHPVDLGVPLASLIFSAGVAAIYINYDSDRQRQVHWLEMPIV